MTPRARDAAVAWVAAFALTLAFIALADGWLDALMTELPRWEERR